MKSTLNKILKYALSASIAAVLLWFSFRDVDFVVSGCGPSRDHSATHKFPDAGEYEIGNIADIHSVECGDTACMRIYGK